MLLVVGVSCLLISSAQATLLFSEGFDYTSGTGLSGSGPWSSGGNSAALAIGAGNLTYPGLLDLGGNELIINNGTATSSVATFTSQTSGKVYYSFLFNAAAVNSANSYFTAMNNASTGSSGAPNGSSDVIDAYYYTNGKMYLRANALSATAGTGTALTLNQTYLIVEMYDIDNKTASLWINPTPGDPEPATTAFLSGTTGTSIDRVGFKAQSSAGGPYTIDTLRVGTTWEDVTPAVVPEPSTIALAAAGIGLMFGLIRRRRS
jgi:hypothetical protein